MLYSNTAVVFAEGTGESSEAKAAGAGLDLSFPSPAMSMLKLTELPEAELVKMPGNPNLRMELIRSLSGLYYLALVRVQEVKMPKVLESGAVEPGSVKMQLLLMHRASQNVVIVREAKAESSPSLPQPTTDAALLADLSANAKAATLAGLAKATFSYFEPTAEPALKPRNAPASMAPLSEFLRYRNRAAILMDLELIEGATADLNKAIAHANSDEARAGAHASKAEALIKQRDLKVAAAELSRSLELNPKNTLTRIQRAKLRFTQGDYDLSAEDFTQVLEQSPNDHLSRFNRATAWRADGKLKEALKDYEEVAAAQSAANFSLGLETQLAICVLREALGEKDAGIKELRAHLAKWPPTQASEWTKKTADYLAQTISEADYLAAIPQKWTVGESASAISHCQAWYYVGMRKLAQGDREAAIDLLLRSHASKGVTMERIFAATKLRRLGVEVPGPKERN
jgi:tetratricopeptide (TPR) repeat protein